MKRPNILYIHSHDTGRYIQPHGHAVATPNLQVLAEEGVFFRKAFCVGPTCSPSRAGLLTGQCAHSNGMLGLAHTGFSLNDYGQHILHTLREMGYFSALIGRQHIAQDSEVIGYDEVQIGVNGGGCLAKAVAPRAVRFLEESPPEPFFLSVGFTETHRGFPEPGAREDARYSLPPATLPDTPEARRDMAGFKASARDLDQGIGAVLTALERSGLAANTLVVCTTDHGIAFPGMKATLRDDGIGVMLILRGPAGFTGGRVCDGMVSHVDIFPTICDLLDVPAPLWLEGESLMPLVRGEAEEVNDEVFAELNYHADPPIHEPQRAVRTNRYKYIRRFSEGTSGHHADDDVQSAAADLCDESASKDLWIRHGWRDRAESKEQLYDLVFDPNEANNLANDPRMESVRKDLANRLAGWMEATRDPVLGGTGTATGTVGDSTQRE